MNNLILCNTCKNYKQCNSFWKDSVNSVNCTEEYGLYESEEEL